MSITPHGFEYERINFPVGEMHVRLTKVEDTNIGVELSFEKNEEIIELLFVADMLKRARLAPKWLTMDYIPFGRQDRTEGSECFSLKVFADLVNSMEFEAVYTTDPHSDVTAALFNNLYITPQWEVFQRHLMKRGSFWLIAPDAGAIKKIDKLAKRVHFCKGVVECSKRRDTKTGHISEVVVHANGLMGDEGYVVDDICDGGGTFILLADAWKARGGGPLHLMVTHGFFTKGIEVLTPHYTTITTSKGVIYDGHLPHTA